MCELFFIVEDLYSYICSCTGLDKGILSKSQEGKQGYSLKWLEDPDATHFRKEESSRRLTE